MAKIYPDISHHHPVKDWDRVQANVGFIISKATQGVRFVDSTLKTFVAECESRGIPYWLYTYLNKGNELEQAKFMVKTCAPLVGRSFVGYVLDAEEDNDEQNLMTALSWLKTQSRKCMLYVGWSDYNKYMRLITTRGENVAWWEARYGRDTGEYSPTFPCHSGVDLHQYSSNGVCPGIPDKIDVNRLTGSKSLKWFQGSSGDSSASAAEPKGFTGTFPELPSRGYYTVGDGYQTNPGRVTDIKNLQKLVNWITGGSIAIDGKYGKKTAEAVKAAQKILGVTEDGLFGRKTLLAAKRFVK